jgi:hypothetical protein
MKAAHSLHPVRYLDAVVGQEKDNDRSSLNLLDAATTGTSPRSIRSARRSDGENK